jgi:trans-AT polyketide synthase/acyltransferase/oxidoreductase domain-containing protein
VDPKHKMALVFRSYLGRSSIWAIQGEPTRRIDYQVWCGPAMGAFNQWVKGSFLEAPANRRTVEVALNLLFGAAVATRANWLRAQGIAIPAGAGAIRPLALEAIQKRVEAFS